MNKITKKTFLPLQSKLKVIQLKGILKEYFELDKEEKELNFQFCHKLLNNILKVAEKLQVNSPKNIYEEIITFAKNEKELIDLIVLEDILRKNDADKLEKLTLTNKNIINHIKRNFLLLNKKENLLK